MTTVLSILLPALLLFCVNLPLSAALSTSQHPPVAFQVREELESSFFVGNVVLQAHLQELYDTHTLTQLRFRFINQPQLGRRYFDIDEGGNIHTVAKIDRESICPHKVVCSLHYDVAVSPMKYFRIIKTVIEVLDENDYACRFSAPRVSHVIMESAAVGSSVSIPAAQDLDSPDNGIKGYRLEPATTVFALRQFQAEDGVNDLRLELRHELDREKEDHYRFTVICYDAGSPPRSGSVSLYISVGDANDNKPRFENDTYNIELQENLPVRTHILRVRAHDPDTGLSGELQYQFAQLTRREFGHIFTIDRNTGQISLQGTVDYETYKSFVLIVIAKDRGPDAVPAQTRVVIKVIDANDNSPYIEISTLNNDDSATIRENSKTKTFLAHVRVRDPDSGRNGQFSCYLIDNQFELQKIYSNEYKVVSAIVFDREERARYSVEIRCSDHGTPSLSTTRHLVVYITDLNDNPPSCTRPTYTALVAENNKPNAYLLRLNASDPDAPGSPNSKLRYELSDDVTDIFRIDYSTGTIVANVVFDFETVKKYQFHVQVTDGAPPFHKTKCNVMIEILDIDDELPVFDKDRYTFEVAENKGPQSKVGQVKASDADGPPYNEFTFLFDPKSRSTRDFRIDPSNGEILTRTMLDREKESVHHLVAVAQSLNNPAMSATVSVTVYVIDVNDNAPTWQFPTPKNNTVVIGHKAVYGKAFAHVLAHDRDMGTNAKVRYYIQKGNERKLFTLDSFSGALSLYESLPNEDNQRFELHLTASDNGEPAKFSRSRLIIEVKDPHTGALARFILFANENLIILIAIGCGTVLLVFITVLTLWIVHRKRRRRRRQHNGKSRETSRETEKMLQHQQNHCSRTELMPFDHKPPPPGGVHSNSNGGSHGVKFAAHPPPPPSSHVLNDNRKVRAVGVHACAATPAQANHVTSAPPGNSVREVWQPQPTKVGQN